MHAILPWVIASLSVALLLSAGVLWLLQQRRHESQQLPTEWTLTPRPVFSTEERRVYRQLREALPHHIVLSKLPLVRFCQPSDPQQVNYWYRLLGALHVTFAVCSANGRVLVAMDLESDRTGSMRSTRIKQSVLAACRVRYLHCAADQLPSVAELQLLLPQHGEAARSPQPAPVPADARTSASTRRREQATLWRESSYMHDSFFSPDSGNDPNAPSGFGLLRSGFGTRAMAPLTDDARPAAADPAAAKLRH